MNKTDTICAVSTPAGVGGIAVVRLSGPDAKPLAERCLLSPTGKGVTLKDHKALFANLFDGDVFIDEVVATWFAAPHSYTGEDVVEVSCHGSLYVQQRALQLFVAQGARIAEAGEYTLRAFLNGRKDLSQAEAVADLIESRSPMSHSLAVSQMRGGYAKELEQMRSDLVSLAALMELELDFSEEDVEFANRQRLSDLLDAVTAKVSGLVDSFQTGNAFKNGIPVAIVGRPNAGKSSLLNALLADDRAIVSPIAGTTRDTIEETMTIDGITFRFIDTAGLRKSDDTIESLGFGRSIKAANKASIILYVRDVTVPFDKYAVDDVTFVTSQCDMKNKHLFLVHNRCDLPHGTEPPGHVISALKGTGLDELKQSLVKVARNDASQNNGVLLTNARHYEAMRKVLAALGEVRAGLDAKVPSDLVVVDLRDALYHLGTITGTVTSDELLHAIFSRFCIGK